MSNFATGFLQSLGDAAHQRAARQHQLDMEEKQKEAQFHWGALDAAIKRGGYTDGQGTFHQYSPDDYNNMVQTTIGNISKGQGTGKAVKEIYQKAQGMIGAVSQHPDFWGGAGSPPSGTPGLQPPDSKSAASPVPSTPGSAPVTADTSQAPAGTTVSSMTIPPPPGASASASPDASADSSPAIPPTVAVATHPDDSMVGVSTPPDGGAVTSVEPPAQDPGAAAAAGPSAPAGAPNPGKVIQGLVPPGAGPAPQSAPIAPPPAAPGYTPNQMLHAFESPEQSALRQANLAGIGNQRAFELQQQQLQQKIAAFEKNVGRKANSTEVALMSGIKLPAGMLVPHYNSKVVMADNAPANGVMVDGSSPSEHQGQIIQQVGQGPDMTPIYNVTDMKPTIEKVGNQFHAYHPLTHEDLGAISGPVNLGTSASSNPAMRYLGPDGQWHQSTGTRSTSPVSANAPIALPGTGNSSAGSSSASPISTAPGMVGKPSRAKPNNLAHAAATATNMASSKTLPGMTLPNGSIPAAQLAQQQNRNTAINVAGQGLTQFVAPQEDGFSNLALFKDPAAVDRVANYLSLADAKLEGEYNDAEKGGTSGVLAFFAGLPQAYQAAQVGAVKDAYDKLTPFDKRFVADLTSLRGQWGGARKGTGASASLYNWKNMSQEIPNPVYIKSYGDAVKRSRNMIHELNQMGEPNTKAKTYNESDLFPAQKPTALQPPGGGKKASTSAPVSSKGVVSLADAMGMDENKGKTADQITKHIASLGYTVGP